MTLTVESLVRIAMTNPINAQITARLPSLGLDQCMLTAGCLFQAVWNHQTQQAPPAGFIRRESEKLSGPLAVAQDHGDMMQISMVLVARELAPAGRQSRPKRSSRRTVSTGLRRLRRRAGASSLATKRVPGRLCTEVAAAFASRLAATEIGSGFKHLPIQA
ncbi:hypothetical protein M1E16_08015 [Pseudomonas sp. Z2-11]